MSIFLNKAIKEKSLYTDLNVHLLILAGTNIIQTLPYNYQNILVLLIISWKANIVPLLTQNRTDFWKRGKRTSISHCPSKNYKILVSHKPFLASSTGIYIYIQCVHMYILQGAG